MRKLFFAGMFTACMAWTAGFSQTAHQIVIKGGHVIDPKNNIDGVLDVAIDSGKITAVAANIDASGASQVVDAKGLLVTPGLIDIHTHVFWGVEPDHQYANGNLAIQPDGFTFRNGVTTIVDAGSSGWRNFATFKAQTIDQSRTRVLAFLNIVGEGMRGGYEQNMNDMDAKMAATIARQYPKDIVGFKLAHYNGHDWTPTERVVAAGRMAGNLPVMIDFGGSTPALSLEKLYLEYLRPGDIYTHCFAQIDGREYIYDTEAKKMKPFTYVARKKGIQFDVGYGGISFAYSQGIGAIKEGFYPNSISTDLHVGSMNAAMKDMLTTMTKFLAMGMPLQAVIEASTWNPAQEIQHKELGHLSVGAIADVAILDLQQGKFGLFDYTGYKLTTDKKLACAMTIRDGRIVYDLNGIAEPVIVGGGRRKPNDKFAEWYQTLPSSNNKKLTPHASINQAEFFRQYQKNPAYWNKAFDYLHTTDLAALKPGTYQIDSGNVFAIVVDAVPNELEKVKWEAHRDFNDLQYIIRGKATMGVASVDDPSGKVIVPYSPTNDILHFSNELGSYYPADQGSFFIFTPLEMHRPGIRAEGKGAIKKVVIKVRVP